MQAPRRLARPGMRPGGVTSSRRAASTLVPAACGHSQSTRRALLINLTTLTPILLASQVLESRANEPEAVEITSDVTGSGSHAATDGDLLLIHYVGQIEPSGIVFDSTRGGLNYRDGGLGVFRPVIVQLGSTSPTPGIIKGLREGLYGMKVGGKRTILVQPEKGFGGQLVGAPYAVVPPNSVLRYEIELLRLSTKGPDELTRGIARCGTGGASASSEACKAIEIKEFI